MVQDGRLAVRLNQTDRITLLYNLILVIFVLTFKGKIESYTFHLIFNVGIISLVFLIGFLGRRHVGLRLVQLWYPIVIYTFLYYQTGLINRVVLPHFVDDFFLGIDIAIFGKFPGFILYGDGGNTFLDEFFHFFYFSYYLLIPVTGILLHRKDEKLFERFVFQVSALFYTCYIVYLFLPVEGPIDLRNSFYHDRGLFRQIVDFIYQEGENPGAAFPSSHVAVTFLVAWWGSRHINRGKVCYWLIFLFLSLSTVYCMFHYAVDVIGGMMLAAVSLFVFNVFPGEMNRE